MSVLKLLAIGFIVMVTPTLGTDSPEALEMKKKVQIQILKGTSDILFQEFKRACESNISDIKYFNPAPEKPEGYGNSIQYYTKSDKIRLMNQLTKIIKTAENNVHEIISNLEKKENETPYSDEDILKIFRNIYGILNEGRKNCALSLSQIEKQALKTQTLKESQATLKENQEALKNCQTELMKKKPSKLSQAKNLVGLGKKKTEDTSSMPSTKKKVNPDEEQRRIREVLKKSGLM